MNKESIMNKKKVCVVGLGYVGLPLAHLCIEKGFEVYGLDIDKEKIDMLKRGESPIEDKILKEKSKKVKDKLIATTDSKVISESDIIVVCVPTPVDSSHHPDLKPLISSAESISKFLRRDHVIIIESTVNPGVTEQIIKPILEKSGLEVGGDFYLAHCPERIDPGNKKWTVENIPRVVGGVTNNSTKKAAEFYRGIINAEILELSSSNEAEAVKIMENAFRDINIAFVNELAISFDKLGIDIMEVIKGASTKPFAFMPHYPGCGVGGHCIPVDPYYLIEKGEEEGFNYRFLSLARVINNSMPSYTIQRIIDGLNEIGKSVKGTKIAVLGLAYKGGVDDTRDSPAFEIIDKLKKMSANVKVYDPYVLDKSTVFDVNSTLTDVECIVIITNHPEFKKLKAEELKGKGVRVVIDGRNCLNKKEIKDVGIVYKGIGR